MNKVRFIVTGIPRPKQSVKIGRTKTGRSIFYTPMISKVWQGLVKQEAEKAMVGRKWLRGSLAVEIDFYLPDRKVKDIDNLDKPVLDAMNKIVYKDDRIIDHIRLNRFYGSPEPGITVTVWEVQKDERV